MSKVKDILDAVREYELSLRHLEYGPDKKDINQASESFNSLCAILPADILTQQEVARIRLLYRELRGGVLGRLTGYNGKVKEIRTDSGTVTGKTKLYASNLKEKEQDSEGYSRSQRLHVKPGEITVFPTHEELVQELCTLEKELASQIGKRRPSDDLRGSIEKIEEVVTDIMLKGRSEGRTITQDDKNFFLYCTEASRLVTAVAGENYINPETEGSFRQLLFELGHYIKRKKGEMQSIPIRNPHLLSE